MKIDSSISRPPRKSQDGSAVLVILVLLTIMVVLAAANTVTVNSLRQRVKMLDQRQIQRLAAHPANGVGSK